MESRWKKGSKGKEKGKIFVQIVNLSLIISCFLDKGESHEEAEYVI